MLQEVEAGPCGPSCGVLVGYRIAEARQQPLLVTLHDGAVELRIRPARTLPG